MPEHSVLGSSMLAFRGFSLPEDVRARLTDAPAAGISLYRYFNCQSPAQLRALTDAIQSCTSPSLPLLVAVDQEGGQLSGVVGSTPFPGAMALGAVADVELAERVARAVGRELRAVGVNVNYAPVCDVSSNAANPGIGVRSFGSDPSVVGALAAATVRGLQSAGVAATVKHFPGAGEVTVDTHHGLGVAAVSREHLDAVELAPFRAAIEAGARLVMSGHFGVSALDGRSDLPATLSPNVWQLLRDVLGFDGVTITDALDMRALAQGPSQILDVLAALRAGADLLLCAPDGDAIQRMEQGLVHAAARGLIETGAMASSAARINDLRSWIAGFDQPPLSVVGCDEHLALAVEVAARSITLVRDDRGLLPLRLPTDARILAIMPQPADLTPADTSSTVVPGLAAALRRHHSGVDELIVPLSPSPDEIAAVAARAADYDLLVVGTISASLMPEQAALVRCLPDRPTVTVATRTPYDLGVYSQSTTHVASYSILPPSLDALADCLFGAAPFRGRLPVPIADSYPVGHGLSR
jgi:beta-N-acetylhexosaminidase